MDIRQYLSRYKKVLTIDHDHRAELEKRCRQIMSESFTLSEIELLEEIIDEIDMLDSHVKAIIFKFGKSRRNKWSTERDNFKSNNICRVEILEYGVDNLLEEIKREVFIQAMHLYQGNMARVADYLGISYKSAMNWKKNFMRNDGADHSPTRLLQ